MGVLSGDSKPLFLLYEFWPLMDGDERNIPYRAEWFSWLAPRRISGTLPFLDTTKTIIKYNLIVCKVLIELVLARTNRD